MIHCYPIISGKKKREWFYSDWDEVPVSVFIKYMELAKKIKPIEDKLNKLYLKIVDQAKDRALLQANNSIKKAELVNKAIVESRTRAEGLQKRHDVIVFEMVSLFTSVPACELSKFSNAVHEEKNDNHFESYRIRLDALTSSPLPTDQAREFLFQSKTDAEIQKLKDEYNKMSLIRKLLATGKALKKTIEYASESTYYIQDIWLQSTMANKQFQQQANAIVAQIENDDYSGLCSLVALITTEANQDGAAIEEVKNSNNSAYLEVYRKQFLKVFKYRLSIFEDQKHRLSIGLLKRIANFFLHNCKT